MISKQNVTIPCEINHLEKLFDKYERMVGIIDTHEPLSHTKISRLKQVLNMIINNIDEELEEPSITFKTNYYKAWIEEMLKDNNIPQDMINEITRTIWELSIIVQTLYLFENGFLFGIYEDRLDEYSEIVSTISYNIDNTVKKLKKMADELEDYVPHIPIDTKLSEEKAKLLIDMLTSLLSSIVSIVDTRHNYNIPLVYMISEKVKDVISNVNLLYKDAKHIIDRIDDAVYTAISIIMNTSTETIEDLKNMKKEIIEETNTIFQNSIENLPTKEDIAKMHKIATTVYKKAIQFVETNNDTILKEIKEDTDNVIARLEEYTLPYKILHKIISMYRDIYHMATNIDKVYAEKSIKSLYADIRKDLNNILCC